ncbi:hypothetical protein FTUN_5965 [Frigoriglobus tundricola]|uniref:ISKra4 family transposase n=2 Tax=Frigoriglobus tundricola TaxID=2774151 RepID=A0A6M5YF63_9BACT|nr:hypothetical protein FTUN_0115 [Frigoriglobus tundricola]QJW95718.1 hypothetical protein FTUN_3272 [Frigoriglobus tundricola]QJW98375.1 hypothetical protein FTUN_5965 [Frigoriglobus tundricola]
MTLTRHYYHCADCGTGTVPFDHTLGLGATRQTPAAREVIALAGSVDSFAEAADTLLPKLSGLRVSESTVERVTEAVGSEIGRALAGGAVFGEARPWDWHRDADGRTVAYVSCDATGVRIQGPGGATADGRMVNVGMVYNPIPEEKARWAHPGRARPAWQARYVTSLDGLDGLGEPLRRQGGQVGMDGADRWVAISDGGSGLEEFLTSNFPRVEVVILDFYHASEYLGAIGRAWHPGDEERSKAWSAEWCHALKHTGGEAVLSKLRVLEGEPVPAAARVPLAEAVRYFGNQKHRMYYPSYRAKGWQIGSGPVESACKSVVGARMKQAGMRWGTDGADQVGHIRGLFRGETGQWDAFWSRN